MPGQIRGVVFDMDDTLYLERDYVRSGFHAVSEQLPDSGRAFSRLWEWFETGVRGDTFDRLLKAEPQWATRVTTAALVDVYRSHRPQIELLSPAAKLLAELQAVGISTGVLTDGPERAQRAKVDALGLKHHVDMVLMTDTLGREHWKPSEAGFIWMEEQLGLSAQQLVYIGDNPVKDFIAPKRRGWATVRLRLRGQLRFNLESTTVGSAAEHEVLSWEELSTWVWRWLRCETN